MGIHKIIIILHVVLMVFTSCKKEKVFTENDIQIIPKPVELKLSSGVFQFTEDTKFVVDNDTQIDVSNVLISRFRSATGWELKTVKESPKNNYVQFITDESFNDEAYNLSVTENAVTITASGNTGFVYGMETLRQLLPTVIESSEIVSDDWVIPNVEINDAPRFKWRGLMLDVSRHFFEKEYIKKTIDRLAFLKMNTLHWHLVDDQGWRIEIKKYPKLTEVGAWRVDQENKPWDGRYTPKLEEKATYGGFYTQEDVKEIVAYAEKRGITVVPEIEMPAHVTSAIASYPELSCLEKPVPVPSGGVWPITDIYCAGKDSTFKFLENVLLEVMELFPSKYIHVGGDEATKTNWNTCKHCQKRMKDEKLKSPEELQSYFIKRMERFISSKGRTLIGWDEILEGGLAPGATVMSWRGVKGGLEASEEGHDVVMTPGTHCYFDHYQGDMDFEPKAWGGYTPVSKVYEFDPVVEGMTKTQANHVLGGQANLWSEFIPAESHSEYMLFPRLTALSEALWSPKANRSWEGFSGRMMHMFKRFDLMGINYAKSAFNVIAESDVDGDVPSSIKISFKNELVNPDIRYVLDSGDLANEAIPYKNPIIIDTTTTIIASFFKDGKPVGRSLKKTFNFHNAVGKKVFYDKKYSDKYKGQEVLNMVNVIRGSKDFHDGQWQAWLVDDMELTIDLGELAEVQKVTVGALENQNPQIYFPTQVEVLVSDDNKTYFSVGTVDRPFKPSMEIGLKDFVITFDKRMAKYIKVKAKNLGKGPKGNDSWIFVDEVLVE